MATASEHPFDERSKTYYTQYFVNRQIRAGRQFEVFSRGRSIDVVTECTEENLVDLQDTCFSHFRRVNSLELKGPHDPLTASDLNLIISRIWAIAARDRVERKEIEEESDFLSQQTLQEVAQNPSQRTVTIVCVTRPDKVLDDLKDEFHFEATAEAGVYHSSKLGIPIWIIHPDELGMVPKNYPLLTLSRGKKLQQFIDLCIDNDLESALHFVVDIALTLDPSDVLDKILEVLYMKTKIRPETILYFDQVLKDVPDLIWQTSTLREAVKQSETLGETRGETLGRQNALINLLGYKFIELSDEVTSLIRHTTDAEQLEQWTRQTLTASTLDEMFPDIGMTAQPA